MPIYVDYDIRRLVAAVCVQAAKDARDKRDRKARAWLRSEGIAWLDACGMDSGYVSDWLKRRQKRRRKPTEKVNLLYL